MAEFLLCWGGFCDRDMKKLSLHFWMPARKWISRIDTSGAR